MRAPSPPADWPITWARPAEPSPSSPTDCEKSLVSRDADPTDGRAQVLRLTTAGRALVPRLAALADRNDAEFFDHIAPKERAALVKTLQGIVERRGLQTLPVD